MSQAEVLNYLMKKKKFVTMREINKHTTGGINSTRANMLKLVRDGFVKVRRGKGMFHEYKVVEGV